MGALLLLILQTCKQMEIDEWRRMEEVPPFKSKRGTGYGGRLIRSDTELFEG